ncbi:MAG: GNAT family N-acetyltransferase [Gemmatimonadota bacterium]
MTDVRPEIRVVTDGPDFDDFVELFSEYQFLPHNEGRSTDPEGEIARLPGPYVEPTGACVLSRLDGRPVGCVVLAALEPPRICELKRLYVRSDARGHGLGRGLVLAVMEEARRLGYTTMRLDTAPELAAAQSLYLAMGFVQIEPYHQRYGDALYFEIELTD